MLVLSRDVCSKRTYSLLVSPNKSGTFLVTSIYSLDAINETYKIVTEVMAQI